MDSKIKRAFAGVLTDARTKAGLSKQELADQSNMSVTFVKKLESGRAVPSLETIWKLSCALDLSLETIGLSLDSRLKKNEKN